MQCHHRVEPFGRHGGKEVRLEHPHDGTEDDEHWEKHDKTDPDEHERWRLAAIRRAQMVGDHALAALAGAQADSED